VHRVGYGAMQLAGDDVFGPPRDRAEALRVLTATIEGGINHLDTAQHYGPATVNELIQEALYPYPSNLASVRITSPASRRRGAHPPAFDRRGRAWMDRGGQRCATSRF
jgi:pyridoxine 4-dehydrogenase